MTERQLRRIINEEINNILNEATQYAVPEEFEGIIANDPAIFLKKRILLVPEEYADELPFRGIDNTLNNKYALVVFFKDPLTNESETDKKLSGPFRGRSFWEGAYRPTGLGIALSDNASDLMQIANKISKQRGRLGSQLTRDLVCPGINTSKYVADICAIYDVNIENFSEGLSMEIKSMFGTVTMEQEIQTQMFR